MILEKGFLIPKLTIASFLNVFPKYIYQNVSSVILNATVYNDTVTVSD